MNIASGKLPHSSLVAGGIAWGAEDAPSDAGGAAIRR